MNDNYKDEQDLLLEKAALLLKKDCDLHDKCPLTRGESCPLLASLIATMAK